MNYLKLLENLAAADNIKEAWRAAVEKEKRVQCADQLKDFIRKTFGIETTFDGQYFDARAYTDRIGKYAAMRIWNFLTTPEQVIKVYGFE